MMMLEFHKPVNCLASRYVPAGLSLTTGATLCRFFCAISRPMLVGLRLRAGRAGAAIAGLRAPAGEAPRKPKVPINLDAAEQAAADKIAEFLQKHGQTDGIRN